MSLGFGLWRKKMDAWFCRWGRGGMKWPWNSVWAQETDGQAPPLWGELCSPNLRSQIKPVQKPIYGFRREARRRIDSFSLHIVKKDVQVRGLRPFLGFDLAVKWETACEIR